MKRKKWTPDEFRAWRAEREARIKALRDYVDRAKVDLEAKRGQKPA
jgi:hypothetical protein